MQPPGSVARPASGWRNLVLALSLLGLGACLAQQQSPPELANNHQRQLREADLGAAQSLDLLDPSASSSVQVMSVRADAKKSGEKLHKFAYDISLNKQQQQQQQQRQRRQQSKTMPLMRRTNDKLIDHDARRHVKRTTKVPSLFFDDEENVNDHYLRPTTTTTLATDNLLIIYDKRANNKSSDPLTASTGAEKYQPQVQTTLESQWDQQETKSSRYRQEQDAARETSAPFSHHKDQSARSLLPADEIKLKPILLTSGIRVSGELNFSPEDDGSRTRNLAGSAQVAHDQPTMVSERMTNPRGGQSSVLTSNSEQNDSSEPSKPDVGSPHQTEWLDPRIRLRHRTELAPTRLVIGLSDESSPPMFHSSPYLSVSSNSSTSMDNRIGLPRRKGDNSNNGQADADADADADNELADQEENYPYQVATWQPPYKRNSASAASHSNQLAQTSSGAIRVVAGDSSLPLVINNHGLITAVKSSASTNRKWQPSRNATNGTRQKRPGSATTSRLPAASPVRRPWIQTITEASSGVGAGAGASSSISPINGFTSSVASLFVTDDDQRKPSELTASTANNSLDDPQNWSFFPNPPYQRANLSSSAASTTLASSLALPVTTRPSAESSKKEGDRPKSNRYPAITQPSLQDLSGSSSSSTSTLSSTSIPTSSHAASSSADTLTTTANLEDHSGSKVNNIGPPANSNQNQVATTNAKKHNIRHKLQNMIKHKLILQANKKQSALTNSSSVPIRQVQQVATPPPLLSSTVANNVANLLTQTMGSLIMRQAQQQQQQQQVTQTHLSPFRPIGLLGAGQRIRQRLGVGKTNANLNRRATSVGSLLVSGLIYGLSVLPALMAITGINPLSGSDSANGGSSLRKTEAGRRAKKHEQARKSSKMSQSSHRILLANLPYPGQILPIIQPPASLMTDTQSSSEPPGGLVIGGQLESATGPDTLVAATDLLNPIHLAEDYAGPSKALAATSALGGLSNLHPLIDTPDSFVEMQPTNVSSSTMLPSSFHKGEDHHHHGSNDLDNSFQRWRADFSQPISSTASQVRPKVQRDLSSKWKQQQQQQQHFGDRNHDDNKGLILNYNSNNKAPNPLLRPTEANAGARQQWQPPNRHPHASSIVLTSTPGAGSLSMSKAEQQLMPMPQQSSNLKASFFDQNPPSSQPILSSSSSSNVAATADSDSNLRDPSLAPRFVSPTNQQQPTGSWPHDFQGDMVSKDPEQQQQQQQLLPNKLDQPFRGKTDIVNGRHSAWQIGDNNFPTSISSSSSSAASGLDYALLGPYEPFLALQLQTQQRQSNPSIFGGQISLASSTRSRRTAPSKSLPYRANDLGNWQQQSNGIPRPEIIESSKGHVNWSGSRSHNHQEPDSGSQWKAISQPVVRSNDHIRRDDYTMRTIQSTRRLGEGGSLSSIGSIWQPQNEGEVILTRSMAFGVK